MPTFGDILRAAAAAAAAGGVWPVKVWGRPLAPLAASLSIAPSDPGASVPADFVGLSYESKQLETPIFFSPDNQLLVRAFRELSGQGVLRLGGNTSEFSWWKEGLNDVPPPRRAARASPGQPPPGTSYAITPQAIDALDGFLRATGWSCIYGLNLGNGAPETTAREAAYVAKRLGSRLRAFAIGNEPDLFGVHLRDPASWRPTSYVTDWLAAAQAVGAAAPNVRFMLPEVAFRTDWLPLVADAVADLAERPALEAVSHHYYAGGPATNSKFTGKRLLRADSRIELNAEHARRAAGRLGVSYRMTEGNSCFQGGKPGVSDAFVSALWAADFLLSLMALGYAGAHLHGGSGDAVATSVGGLPGERVLPDAAPRPRPFYSPIGTIDGRSEPQPVFWGMKFAGLFAGRRMLPVEFDANGANATAYAARTRGGALIAIVNKDPRRDLSVALSPHSLVATLTGANLQSRQARLATLESAPLAAGPLRVDRSSAVAVRLAG